MERLLEQSSYFNDEKDVAAYWLKQAKIQVEKIELSEERLMEIAGESIFSGDRLQTYQFHPDQLVRFTGKAKLHLNYKAVFLVPHHIWCGTFFL